MSSLVYFFLFLFLSKIYLEDCCTTKCEAKHWLLYHTKYHLFSSGRCWKVHLIQWLNWNVL